MAHDFERLVNQYIPAGQKSEFLASRPHYAGLLGQEVDDLARDAFVKDALEYLGLLGQGVNTEHHTEVANPVNDPASLVVPSAPVVEPVVATVDVVNAPPVVDPSTHATVYVPQTLVNVVMRLLAATPDELAQVKAVFGIPG